MDLLSLIINIFFIDDYEKHNAIPAINLSNYFWSIWFWQSIYCYVIFTGSLDRNL